MSEDNWHILVVEDDPDGQELVVSLLRHNNIPADGVFTAEEALPMLDKNSYSSVLIDLALPGMDGWNLLTHIRNNPETASIPCIAMTAFHTSVVRQRAIEYGFDGYLVKPLDDQTFIEDVRHVIE